MLVMSKKNGFLLFFLLLNGIALAQQAPSFRQKRIQVRSDTLQLDTLAIAPGSVIITTAEGVVPDSLYKLIPEKGLLIFRSQPADSLDIAYRTFPPVFTQRYAHKDPRLISPAFSGKNNPFMFSPEMQKNDILSFGNLNKSGSISRGITVGNNQDLSVNSSLNLQLNGRLSDEVEVIAVISDDNIPIQPEGNTQQIQDFDKVFIQLKNNENVLTAGDFELRRPDSYFMNFFKKAKGGYFTTTQKPFKDSEYKLGVAGAVAKGKYTRYTFSGMEGNQGPYRLKGDNNESFIIVLAGTERVYIDGVLMKRGEDQDYVIDYNTAELRFTQKRLITQYSRISVEYEYSDRNYSRSLLYLNNEFRRNKLALRVNFYSEQDSRNQPLLQELDDEQKRFLSTIGDNLQDAFYPNVDSLGFNPNEIRYKKTDSLGYTIYMYSVNPDSAVYRLGFTQVGSGKGNYVQANTIANGKVFTWVAPAGGLPQGDYEPIVLLITPKKSQLLTYAADYELSAQTKLSFEGAFSNQDQNLYSSLGNADNTGFASRTTLTNKKMLRKDSLRTLNWASSVAVEFTDKNFRPLERYRPVEFEREFNIAATATRANELLISASTGIERNNLPVLQYQFNTFLKDTLYRGFQQVLRSDLRLKKLALRSAVSLLNSEESNSKSYYFKHTFDLSREWKYMVTGLAEESELNRFRAGAADTLSIRSFAFQQYTVYLQNPAAWTNKYRLDYTLREDRLPLGNSFRSSTTGQTLNFNTELNINTNSRLSLGATYRKLEVQQDASGKKPEESVLARAQYDFSAWKGFLSSNTYYEIGTGQEPKREYTYIQVPAGQGVYIHVDYNGNGIKELNEFEIAKFAYEADYIRVYVVSTDFVRTNATVFSETLNLYPERVWGNRTGLRKLVSRFSNQTALKIDRKILDNSNESSFNPFDTRVADTSLITLNSSWRNTFFFKRTDPVFGADYTFQNTSNKSLLSNGFDTRAREEHTLRTRWNFVRSLGLQVQASRGAKTYASQLLTDKNFEISFTEISPELSWQLNTAFRLSLSYGYTDQRNAPSLGPQKAVNQKLSSEARYNASGKGSLSVRISYINNSYNDATNTPVAYEMLDGLQAGNNLTWNAVFQRTVGSNLQLNFVYDGRRSPGVKAIHSGSVQARAFF